MRGLRSLRPRVASGRLVASWGKWANVGEPASPAEDALPRLREVTHPRRPRRTASSRRRTAGRRGSRRCRRHSPASGRRRTCRPAAVPSYARRLRQLDLDDARVGAGRAGAGGKGDRNLPRPLHRGGGRINLPLPAASRLRAFGWSRFRLLRFPAAENDVNDRLRVFRRGRVMPHALLNDHRHRPAQLLVALLRRARLVVEHGSRLAADVQQRHAGLGQGVQVVQRLRLRHGAAQDRVLPVDAGDLVRIRDAQAYASPAAPPAPSSTGFLEKPASVSSL